MLSTQSVQISKHCNERTRKRCNVEGVACILPIFTEHGGPMTCKECGSRNVWTSRLRVSDIGQLLLLKLPVRCHSCLKRDFAGLTEAKRIRRREMASVVEDERQEHSQR